MARLMTMKDGDAGAALSSAVLLKILWDELSDLVGVAATAVVVERAARRARAAGHELVGFTISRVDGHVGYVFPPSFVQARGPSPALRALLDELRPLLVELTGQVAVRHLDEVPELRGWAAA
jgi:hypothetical protein